MYSSLRRGLAVLEILADERSALGLAQIAERLGTSKSGAHGILATLVQCGYAEHAAGGIYRLGPKTWRLGRAVPTVRLVEIAGPVMERLVDRVEEGAILGVLSGFAIVYVHLVGSPQAVRVHAEIGDRIPAHCTSTGLALLAFQEPGYLDRVLPPALEAFTPATITDPDRLRGELVRVRARGYAVNVGGWRSDVGGVAVPIRSPHDVPIAGLCIAAPRYRMTAAWVRHGVAALREAADEIAARLAAPGVSTPPTAAAAG